MIILYTYNEAKMRAPYEDPLWDTWRELLNVVHVQALKADGYLGRYHGENDPLGYIAPRWPQEPLVMGNLSAWRSLPALRAFTFGPGTHAGMVKNRHRWFEPWPFDRPHFVAWWGHADVNDYDEVVPLWDLDTAMLMQAQLGQHGPDANVFGW